MTKVIVVVVIAVVAVMVVVVVLLVVMLVLILSRCSVTLVGIPWAVFHGLYSCGLLANFSTALTKLVCPCLSMFVHLPVRVLSICLSIRESVRVALLVLFLLS